MLPSYLLLPCMQLSKMFVGKPPLVGFSVLREILTAKLNVHMGVISQGSEQCADVFCLHISKTGCIWSKVWCTGTHSPGKPWSVCTHNSYAVGLKTKILLVCKCLMQNFAYVKCFWRHSILLKNSLGAEIQLLLHWQSSLMYDENLRWAGKTSLSSSCDPPLMLAFHGVVLSCSKLSILGKEVALGTEKPLILQWGSCDFSRDEDFTAPQCEGRCCLAVLLWYSRCSGAKPVGFYSFKAISCSPLPMDKLFDYLGHEKKWS